MMWTTAIAGDDAWGGEEPDDGEPDDGEPDDGRRKHGIRANAWPEDDWLDNTARAEPLVPKDRHWPIATETNCQQRTAPTGTGEN
jgi:hypothetical protein